jgi:hypothetical protein
MSWPRDRGICVHLPTDARFARTPRTDQTERSKFRGCEPGGDKLVAIAGLFEDEMGKPDLTTTTAATDGTEVTASERLVNVKITAVQGPDWR